MIVLLYRTGLRLSESLALRVKDINFEVGSLAVLHGKGNCMRTVGIDPGATPRIEAWLERRRDLGLPGDAPLFCTLKGGPLAGNTLREMLNTLAFRAGIEKRVHPHGYADVFVMPTSAGRACEVRRIAVFGSA